jgi:hypothetical protein
MYELLIGHCWLQSVTNPNVPDENRLFIYLFIYLFHKIFCQSAEVPSLREYGCLFLFQVKYVEQMTIISTDVKGTM